VARTQTTIPTERFAALQGASRQLIYRRAKEAPDELLVQPIRLGRSLRWSVAQVARATGWSVDFILHGDLNDSAALTADLERNPLPPGVDSCVPNPEPLTAGLAASTVDDDDWTPDEAA
jgi:hypothetical protein